MAKPSLIRGVVRDANGTAIRDARVWIVGGPGSYPDTAVLSDSRGQFTLSVPEAAKYELACGADGYIQGLAIVDFTDATDITIDFELKPDSV